jgi:hypothetical protein
VTSQTITVLVNGNTTFEPDETFFVNLTLPGNATIATAQGTGTIQNDDPLPSISINNVALPEGNSGTTAFTFTVSLSNASYQAITVNFATADGTATIAAADYQAASGTLTFNPGVTSQTITVLVNGNTTFEPDETFFVNLTTPVSATITTAQGTGTIQNDDPQPAISINNVTLAEGNSGTTAFTFTVSLSNASYQTITVNYATADGTATVADGDYAPVSATLTFAPGATSQTITVLVNGDTDTEPTETFFVNLSAATNASIAVSQGTGTIIDTAPATLSINSVSGNEGGPVFAGSLTFTVTLSKPSAQAVTVQWATADGTGTIADGDYAAGSGTLTFQPGATTQAITVNLIGNLIYENNETFFVNLSNATNAVIAVGQGTGTILNDDPPPTVSINSIFQNEGNTGTTAFVFTVSLNIRSEITATVNYATADGTATVANNDYQAASGTLTFNPGVTSQTITVLVNGNTTFEPDETFFVNLSGPVSATIGTAQGTGTIVNDDPMPAISVNNVALPEGNTGTTPFTFTVSLSNASYQSITVNYATADGTATVANNDYQAASGTLTFAPGVTSQTVTVLVNGNTIFEPDETFFVNLTAPANATIAVAQGTGTIQNDDGLPSMSINNVSLLEGTAGSTAFTFTVTLSNASYKSITVNYATADGTATTADGDYQAATGTLTFAPGVTMQTITIMVNGDTVLEPDETFFVNLSGAQNATIAVNQGLGTILDSGGLPALSINSVSQPDPSSGTTPFTFTVSLSAASTQTVTVNYATADGTATLAENDYQAASGTLTFNPGVTSQTITVLVNGTTTFEPDETFFVNLSAPSGATIAVAQGTGTIQNNIPVPSISINNVLLPEGNSGTTAFTFTVSLSASSTQTITVNYATADGTATVAKGDYQANSGTLTFNPGVTSQTITVLVNGNTTFEPDETFFVNLTAPSNATIGTAQGTGTIQNDDPQPAISINNVTLGEGSSGTVAFTFTVSLSNASYQSISVNYATADGTARVADGDYTAVTGTLTFAPGVTSQTITVLVNGDNDNEPNETFFVNLSAAANASLAVSQGTGTIVDSFVPSILSINSVSANEGGPVFHGVLTFTVTLSNPSSQTVTVQWATADGTGTVADGDYQAGWGP